MTQQPNAKAADGIDLSLPVGVCVAAGLYALLTRSQRAKAATAA